MMFRLYHAKNLREVSFASSEEISALFHLGDNYEFVGYIDAANLEEVYMKTQNIDEAWTSKIEASQLSLSKRAGCRSTSMGDVILDDDSSEYAVASFGFDNITSTRVAKS